MKKLGILISASVVFGVLPCLASTLTGGGGGDAPRAATNPATVTPAPAHPAPVTRPGPATGAAFPRTPAATMHKGGTLLHVEDGERVNPNLLHGHGTPILDGVFIPFMNVRGPTGKMFIREESNDELYTPISRADGIAEGDLPPTLEPGRTIVPGLVKGVSGNVTFYRDAKGALYLPLTQQRMQRDHISEGDLPPVPEPAPRPFLGPARLPPSAAARGSIFQPVSTQRGEANQIRQSNGTTWKAITASDRIPPGMEPPVLEPGQTITPGFVKGPGENPMIFYRDARGALYMPKRGASDTSDAFIPDSVVNAVVGGTSIRGSGLVLHGALENGRWVVYANKGNGRGSQTQSFDVTVDSSGMAHVVTHSGILIDPGNPDE
jgi:hypothetical protein